MTPPIPASRPRCDCPALAVEDALTLLATGRAAMARTVLEPLPGLIRGHRAAVASQAGRPAVESRELRVRVGRALPEVRAARGRREREMGERDPPPRRAAGLLRVGPADVQALAEGRVGLPASAWRRLLREIGDG